MPVTVMVRSGARAHGAPGEQSLSITLDSPMVVIGRGEGSEVRLPDPSVSHRHATIRQRGSEYILVDEGSTNGTFMGGVKLGTHAPRILRHGDLARVGRVWLEIRFDHPIPAAQTAMATKELALALVARAMDAEGGHAGPRITVVEGPDVGRVMFLEEAARAYVIGRGREADLAVEDADASRRHVHVVRRADQVLVRDLSSKNGAQIGGEPLGERDRIWRIGETLRVGKNVFAYEHDAAEALLELERAADEKIREGEIIAPPEPVARASAKSDVPSGSRAALDASGGVGAEMAAAPIAELPVGSAASPPSRRRGGWNSTDFLVVLLAVGVLALSVVGLVWLLRG